MTEANSLEFFLERATRFLFFTGKGGVGKTSLACSIAVRLADRGERVLLVSTDPASNLDEVLETDLTGGPKQIAAAPGLEAMNIDPGEAARKYRERIVGPIRGVLPEATVANIEEQLSGACSTEIASFNEFSRLLGDETAVADYAYVILDTAPTGHTLRLLALPAAWSGFIAENKTGSSCLGPLAGLKDQRVIYEKTLRVLRDARATTLTLVARADEASLKEASRASGELALLGVRNQALILNGLFRSNGSEDATAAAIERRAELAMANIPLSLCALDRYEVPFYASGISGVESLRRLTGRSESRAMPGSSEESPGEYPNLDALVAEIASSGKGVIMTMGKGGVGKTSLAKRIARSLAEAGHRTHLTTTDPANHVEDIELSDTPMLSVSAIDPKEVTHRHVEDVLATSGSNLDADARALLEEELRSPCTEEIAVFAAFAKEVAKGEDQFVILDTAPTGHTLLLLDATEAYHREVLKNADGLPGEVRALLPRLRDQGFTKTIIVALPEATPVHEAAQLQEDLRRAKIEPFAWVMNQCISATNTKDPLLLARAEFERPFIQEVSEQYALRLIVEPWNADAIAALSSKANDVIESTCL